MSDTGSCGCGNPAGACTAPNSESKTATSAKSGAIQNGKGSAPRNISEAFRANYNAIRWTTGGKLQKGEKLVKVYR
jgi:hypothetical protein